MKDRNIQEQFFDQHRLQETILFGVDNKLQIAFTYYIVGHTRNNRH